MKLIHESLTVDKDGVETKVEVQKYDDTTAAKAVYDAYVCAEGEKYYEHLCTHDESEGTEWSGPCIKNEKTTTDGKEVIVKDSLHRLFTAAKGEAIDKGEDPEVKADEKAVEVSDKLVL
jgi:hypothetical protein